MKTNEDKIYSFLGLATRAGKIVSGDDSTLLELKRGNVKLVIIAQDSSDNTKKLFKDKSSYRNIPYVYFLLAYRYMLYLVILLLVHIVA